MDITTYPNPHILIEYQSTKIINNFYLYTYYTLID